MITVNFSDLLDIDTQSIDAKVIPSASKYVGLEHIKKNGKSIIYELVKSGDLKSNKYIFSENHILFGKLRPYLAKIVSPNFSGICSTDILPLRPKSDQCKSYLNYFFLQPKIVSQLSSLSSGANLPRLNPKVLKSQNFKVAPIAKQIEFGVFIKNLHELRGKLEIGLSVKAELFNSLQHKAFSGELSGAA